MEQLNNIEPWHNMELVESIAETYYRPLPFHNFQHALETRDIVQSKIDECAANNEPLDEDEAQDALIAALFHDAGFHVPLYMHGFRSKEEYSANIANIELVALDMPKERVNRIMEMIAGTELNIVPNSRGANALRQADLDNVASGNPLSIVRKTIKLFEEDALLKKEYFHEGDIKTDLLSFIRGSYAVLSTYNKDDVALGNFDKESDGVSRFARNIEKNIICFLSPMIESILKRLLG